MKRAFSILLTLMIVLGLLVAGCGGSETESPATSADAGGAASTEPSSQEVFNLTYALFQPEVSALSVMNKEFAKEIEKRTEGRVKITVHAGGSLLAANAMYQGVLDGVADMGNGISSYEPGAFPFTSIGELPSYAQSGWAVSNALYDFHKHHQPEEWSQVHMLTPFSTGADFTVIATGKKELRTIADWSGVSIRTNHADIVKAMGGTVKDLPMADCYDAISKGVIDGVMGMGEPLKSWRLGEVCSWATLNYGTAQPSILWYNIMNQKTWEKLPEDIQQIIDEISREYSAKLGLMQDDQSIEGFNYALEQGTTLYMLPDDEAAKWSELIAPVIDARLEAVSSQSKMDAAEVESIWQDFQDRVDYWNGQQAANDIQPLVDRVRAALQ